MNKRTLLIKYRAILKVLHNKKVQELEMIEKYISRIDTNTTLIKSADDVEIEEEHNKDLLQEVEYLLKELGVISNGN